MEVFILYVFVVGIAGVIALVINLILNKVFKENNAEIIESIKNEHVIIHLPRNYKWIYLMFLSVFLFNFVFWKGIGSGFFVLIGIYKVLEIYLWRIHIYSNDDYFIYVSSLGKKYKVYYSEIINYKDGRYYFEIKTSSKVFKIDSKATNFPYLITMLQKHEVNEVIVKK
jgi:hypothetical protein